MTEMDGMARNPGVVVLAATNRAGAIDPALTRPGRFDLVVPIPLPDRPTRRAILDVHTNALPLEDVDLDDLAERTDGASGAALAELTRAAARAALHRSLENDAPPSVTKEDFGRALHLLDRSRDAGMADFIAERGTS